MDKDESKLNNQPNNISKPLISDLLNHDESNDNELTPMVIDEDLQVSQQQLNSHPKFYQQDFRNNLSDTRVNESNDQLISLRAPETLFTFRDNNHTKEEKLLLSKFENEVMQNSDATAVLTKLRLETKEKYLYQIKRYIRFCAKQGHNDFLIKLDRVNSLIEFEINKRGFLSENTVKSIRSPLNKLFYMNKIVYLSQQPDEYLGDNFIKSIMSKQLGQQQQQQQVSQQSQLPQPLTPNQLSQPQKLKEGNSGTNSGGGSGNSSGNSTLFNLIDSNRSKSNTSTSTTSVSSSNVNKSNLSSTESNTPQTKFEPPDQTQSTFEDSNKTTTTLSSSSNTSESLPSKIFKTSESLKHRITEEESKLLLKFNDEVLENSKTQDILSNLTGNTFKSYATDIKRFIRFCARKGKSDFLIEEGILTRFLTFETKKSKKNKIKNLRTSLLKLHQLNCLAYDLEYSEGDIIFMMNKFLDNNHHTLDSNTDMNTISNPITNVNTENETNDNLDIIDEKSILYEDDEDEDNELVKKLKGYYETTNILNGLSETSKKIYSNEFNRYALFVSEKLNLDNFNLTGELIQKFFVEDIIKRTPTISSKKLTEILSRFNRLHNLNVELNPALPKTIEDIDVVKNFLKEYGAKNNRVATSTDDVVETSQAAVDKETKASFETAAASGPTNNASNAVETSSSSSTSRNGADTLSGASTSSAETSLPQLNYPSEPLNQINVGSSSSDQTSSGEITKSSRRKQGLAAQIPLLSKPKPVFHSYSSRPDVFESTTSTTSSSSGGDKSIEDKNKNRLQRVVEHQYEEQAPQQIHTTIDEPTQGSSKVMYHRIESRVEDDDDDFEFDDDDDDDDEDGNDDEFPKPKDKKDDETQIRSNKNYLPHHKSIGDKESTISKRQKLEILPETNDTIPKFVMNRNIETITQVVEEWSLIVKRNNKYNGIGWIKTIVDFQFYNRHKLIIELIEDVLPGMDEKYQNMKIEQIIDNNIVYELASIFDQYLKRKDLSLDKFIKKCEQLPVYTKKEFLRILSRRKTSQSP